MRSPVEKIRFLGLGCLLLAMIVGSAWADNLGVITAVRLDADNHRIVIDAKGQVGKHLARVIGNPNRLVIDFAGTRPENVPPKTVVDQADIREIRVGEKSSRTRIVVDFRERPVPAFSIRREADQIMVVFGNSLAGLLPTGAVGLKKESETPKAVSAPVPNFVPAAATAHSQQQNASSSFSPSGRITPPAAPEARSGHANDKGSQGPMASASTTRISQTMAPPPPPRPSVEPETSAPPALPAPKQSVKDSRPGPGGPEARMVREVRPPVTPPTPDPRLLVQEITELRFIQVGHNARLMIRGGDQLDYRLNKVSPTKVRLDLINAEIPKAHQKPLRTDLFSTSVEMIVPGSQTIFIQLKDAVPYQINKQKGVLMVDFPPPRFTAERAGGREGGGGGEASRIIQEEQIRKRMESRNQDIERLQKSMEQLQKQRMEILRSFQITPDPEIFKKPVTMDFQGISLKNAFRLLAEQAGVNIIVGTGVTGSTTLRLFDVPLGQVIDTILNTHGLDRVMVGNVMRVGNKKEISDFKEERNKEYTQRVGEVDKRIESIRQEIQAYQKEIEDWLKRLQTLQEAPIDETRTEEIGEAGCIDIEGERVCFQYATVKVTYVRPSQLLPTLRCLFRLDCPGGIGITAVQQEVSELQRVQDIQAGGELGRTAYRDQLAEQGFLPGSPGAIARMQTYDRIQSDRERAAAASATATGVVDRALAAGERVARVTVPFGEDPKLARILAYSILWANDRDRMIFMKDTPERIAQMKKLIFTLDVPTPQVLIESRIVRATRDWSRGMGILWGGRNSQTGPYKNGQPTAEGQWTNQGYWDVAGITGTAGTPTGRSTTGDDIPSQFVVNLPTTIANLSNPVGLGIQFGTWWGQYLTELDVRLQLGEAQGKTKVISRPKVQVLDGQNASIRNGLQIPYQTVSADGTQTQMISADLALNVRPTIYADGRIRMEIRVTNNEPEIVAGASAPAIRTREANTFLIVKDGETAVIGGILINEDRNRRQGLPGLMNMPPISYLFSNKTAERNVQEILVFIAPTIIRRPPQAS
ncbi:MAG: AMIN domain-containing protein [Thermodesulfobacteriota bacterium]